MKILVDTNILVSAIAYGGTPLKAYQKAVSEHDVIICDQTVEELKSVFARKFPQLLQNLDSFFVISLALVQVVSVPMEAVSLEAVIRDTTDRPILRVAVKEDVDIILSGDKDFREAKIPKPKVLSAKEFLDLQA